MISTFASAVSCRRKRFRSAMRSNRIRWLRLPLPGHLEAFCAELGGKGVTFPVELKRGVNGSLLCYVAAPDGVSIELMQC